MSGKRFLVIDFDSTLVTIEALDALAEISLRGHPRKKEILDKIKDITRLGMEGKIPFDESLERRLSLFGINTQHIEALRWLLRECVTPSIIRNKKFIQENHAQIYVISGGFEEYIIPVVREFGIESSHVLANRFLYDKQRNVMGFDKTRMLSKKCGKVKAVKSLGLRGKICVLGDGYTDYEIRKRGAAHSFWAFVENVRRESVVQSADRVVESLDEVVEAITAA